MKIKPVTDREFARFGRVVEGYDFAPLLGVLRETSPKPETGTVYVPSDPALEALPVFSELRDSFYGGMPVQLGYCNGSNTTLNCVEYHRDSEIDIADNDTVLLLAALSDMDGGKLDTAKVEAFLLPAGEAVELYATTLHYAPCDAKSGAGFRVVVVLPRGTNTDKPEFTAKTPEDALLRARNKWLSAHPESPEAADGAFVGLSGENIDIKNLI